MTDQPPVLLPKLGPELLARLASYRTLLPYVSTQAQTHAQIHIHAHIPAHVQLPALFQPHVRSQPSTHLRHNQAPFPATISINPLCLAKMLLSTCRSCIISKYGNEAATFYLLAPGTLVTRSQVYWKDPFPSTVSI